MAAELCGTADIAFDTSDNANTVVVSEKEGAWISVKNVEFTATEGGIAESVAQEETLTGIDSIQYNITVKSVDKDTTLSMYPSAKGGGDCVGSVAVSGAGEELYASDDAVVKYIAGDDAIEFFTLGGGDSATASNASLVDFAMVFYGEVKGSGRVEVRLDKPDGEVLTSIDFDTPEDFSRIYNDEVAAIGGVHDLYFVFSDEGIEFRMWEFGER